MVASGLQVFVGHCDSCFLTVLVSLLRQMPQVSLVIKTQMREMERCDSEYMYSDMSVHSENMRLVRFIQLNNKVPLRLNLLCFMVYELVWGIMNLSIHHLSLTWNSPTSETFSGWVFYFYFKSLKRYFNIKEAANGKYLYRKFISPLIQLLNNSESIQAFNSQQYNYYLVPNILFSLEQFHLSMAVLS